MEIHSLTAELVEYIKPHFEIALEGKRNGHNFNSYMPKVLRDTIPYRYRDIVYSALAIISNYPKDVYRENFPWIDKIEELKKPGLPAMDHKGLAYNLKDNVLLINEYLLALTPTI